MRIFHHGRNGISAHVPAPTLLGALGSALALLVGPGAAPAAAQRLTAEEQAIAAHVEAHVDEGIELLERIVNVNSGTLNPEGVRRVAEILAPEFEALGFDARWAPLPDSLHRAGHLIIERRGSRGKRLLLIGHLDTVFEEDGPFQRFERHGDEATGPGVVDMKGGDIVILQALRALDSVGALDGTTITVVFTGDEESPGDPLDVARRELIDAARRSDIALGFESGSRDEDGPYGVIARRSSSGWTLVTTGRRAHSSGIFGRGVGAGAVYEAARILNDFYEELKGEEYLTFNAATIVGGTDVEYDAGESAGRAFGKSNVVAQRAVVHGDIRTISDEQLQRTRQRMREIVARNLPLTSAEITFSDGYPSMPPTEANRALLSVYDGVSRDLGLGAVRAFDPGERGAADISFVAPYIDAGLDGLGAYGSGSHTPEETLDLASFPDVIQRAALLIYRLTRADDVS